VSTIAEYYDQGVLAKQEGRYEEAAAQLNLCLQMDPDSADAHWQMGLVQCFIGNFDESVAELERAAGLDPNSTKIRNDLGMTLLMLGEFDQANTTSRSCWRWIPATTSPQSRWPTSRT